MKNVIVYPRGQLTSKDKERLTKAGFVAVEADDPKAVVTLVPSAPLLTSDDLIMATMAGLTCQSQYSSKDIMVHELHRRLKVREQERNAAPARAVEG